ncbi:MAG: hypothetical protein D8M57_16995 [Candidatus Scalindua sp. AMX11]|nr:MAG: hypothetical protein DWQ00_12445 [Candidatus Scalindua sp.]NOG84047.1 hypothetical protein [Planctomycetota bacterium]RZV67450.1 MAG: hypothetical protein EX341_17085 [Candidatus Scalindua sp. SCAELEC01]TDE63667.1 MAG: hypothetical protein D8M57_16995 [Candidatus Scalindua sp. AMX11]GJQ60573.1 MAG: hypothetical protein SCALA701_33740 [Candidatus Scalindua sp.]
MKRLNTKNKLFLELETKKPDWWKNIVSEKGVYIDIRKDNYIDIYFNGGNIIRELKFDGKKYSGSINYKYLLSERSEYIKYDFANTKVLLAQKIIDLLSFADFETKSLKRIKDNISKHFPASSEKGIQAKFVNNTDYFLDTEFAYNYKSTKLRIDLVWIDVSNKKIILIELKTMGDSRLYTNEIYGQLKKYNDFAIKFEKDIVQYYQKVFEIKKKLNILPKGLSAISSLKDFVLEKKPLLLFGDCQQKWINNNAKDINARIDKVAVGAYYFGGTKYNCGVISKTNRNRYIF